MLWELLTGRRLFEGTTQEVFARLLMATIPAPSSVAADVPRDLEAITMRLLAHDRESRYATAELAIDDLARCAQAPRNGQGELSRLLAERFPADIAARSSRPLLPVSPSSRATANERRDAAGTTRQDPAPQPTPMAPWARDTTLGSAASQSVASGGAAPRRKGRWIAATFGVVAIAGLTGTAAFLATRGRSSTPSHENTPAATPTALPPARVSRSTLTVTTEPPGAVIRVDGADRGAAPQTVQLSRGGSVTVEAVRDGYEPASQVVLIDRDAQSFAFALRPLSPPASLDAGSLGTSPKDAGGTTTAAAPDAAPAKPATRKPPRGATTKKQGSAAKSPPNEPTFNPDDAIGD